MKMKIQEKFANAFWSKFSALTCIKFDLKSFLSMAFA